MRGTADRLVLCETSRTQLVCKVMVLETRGNAKLAVCVTCCGCPVGILTSACVTKAAAHGCCQATVYLSI